MTDPILTIRGTATMLATETSNVRDVSDRIALLQPDASPLLTFLNALKRKKETTQVKFEWFEDDLVGNTISDASGAGTGTTLTVSSTDGKKVRNGDILIGPTGESIRVTSGQGTTSLTIVRDYGDTVTGHSLSSGDQLVIAGNACDEGGSTPLYRFMPKVPKYNRIQIFRDPVKITTTQAAVKSYGGDDLVYQRKKVAIEHKRGIEQMFLFGDTRATAVSGSNDGYITTTKGLLNWISTNATDVGGTITESEFETFLRTLFRYVASSSAVSKVGLFSPIMVSAVNFWAKNALQVRSDEKTYGMRIATYRSGHGDIEIVRHWLLGDFTNFTKYSFFFDPSSLQYRFLSGLDTKLHTNIGDKTEEYQLDEYRTHCGLQCELEKQHGLLKNITGFAS